MCGGVAGRVRTSLFCHFHVERLLQSVRCYPHLYDSPPLYDGQDLSATTRNKYGDFCLQMCSDDTLYELVCLKHTNLGGNHPTLNVLTFQQWKNDFLVWSWFPSYDLLVTTRQGQQEKLHFWWSHSSPKLCFHSWNWTTGLHWTLNHSF